VSCHGEQIPQGETRPIDAHEVVVEPSLWGVLVADSDILHVAAGELIYEAGQMPEVIAILSGMARVFMWSARGRQVTLRYAGRNELIGLGPQLAGVDVTSAEAVSDTAAAIVPVDGVRRLAAVNPALAWAITEQVAGWASEAVRSLSDVAPLPMTARVAAHLLQVSEPTPTAVSAHLTHQRLADAVGTAREVVSRALGELRRDGVVATSQGHIVITDPTRLAQIARGGERALRQSHRL
jgi:CRP-like cAMP-binding protein